MPDRFRYRAYGLCLDTNRPVRFLVPASRSAEVDVSVEFVGAQSFPVPLTPRQEWEVSAQTDRFGKPNLTIFDLDGANGQGYVQLTFGGQIRFAEFTLSRDARQVWASWSPSAHFEDIAWLLLRPVMAIILWLRGITCLHASVVGVNECAVAFVGRNGAGKSSLALTFAQRGHNVLADDVAVLVDANESVLVQPAYPSLGLLQQTAVALLGPADLPRLWAGEEKRYLSLSLQGVASAFGYEQRALPLAGVYFIGSRGASDMAPSTERVRPAEGLMGLVGYRFMRRFEKEQHRIRQFELLSRLAREVPLRRVHSPNSLTALSLVCDTILQDLHESVT